jgi:3',5'-cyclic AMP phosphodiesterase CpdA
LKVAYQEFLMPRHLERSGLLTRRRFLTGSAGLLAAGALGKALRADNSRRRVLRIGAQTGMTACLHHVQDQKDKPDLILTGGDSIMDSLGATKDRTRLQWKIWNDVLRNECSLPVEKCIGNHDVWGWNQKDSGASPADPMYGKLWATEALGIPERYRSFDKAGWHFVVLDSTHIDPSGEGTYIAKLDEAQFDWLSRDLAAVDPKTPVLVLSHIPIISAAAYYDGDNEKSGNWVVPGSWIHIDARRIKDLFKSHPNVKLCISGHLHLVDRIDYLGVTYLCNGAVCGAWWDGNNQEFEEGYALIDLYSDGSFDSEYVSYGWQPVKG